ncbi:hypothetical protein AYO44_10090 [Planctomycetaceae bacterium SCGC AG-212-F19]|nr:hypothetical protein AYO44_10090 [Planctomycetaceae bacterium SCGC AG-212-F19]
MSTPPESNPDPQSPGDKEAEIKAQRDLYLQSLYALTRTPFTISDEERQTLEQSGLTLEQIIEQIEHSQDA